MNKMDVIVMLAGIFVLVADVEGTVYGYNVQLSKVDCSGQGDGVVEIGCDGYIECRAQTAVKHLCQPHEVFNRDVMRCVPESDMVAGCTQKSLCATQDDGRYADAETNCQTYYTCHSHTFFGHGYCPAGLVFNENLQLCDWPSHVPFPCGTA